MQPPRYPSLYQINTRVWLTALSRTLGRPATLDDIPDAELDRLAEMGFDWVWGNRALKTRQDMNVIFDATDNDRRAI